MFRGEMVLWPNNKKFAFSILDDTDCSTLENAPFIYDFLNKTGFKTTKSVWVMDGEVRDDNKNLTGSTCQDNNYLNWVKDLQRNGFEIASHSNSFSRSSRQQVIDGLTLFKEYFGDFPKILAQHDELINNESIYWGSKRVSGFVRIIYNLINKLVGQKRNIYFGDDVDSEFFWGDICKERIKYVRNFVFPEINTLKFCPSMPYHDLDRPYVNYWFASSEAPDITKFVNLLSKKNIKRLMRENGACIVYTHFGKGFYKDKKLDPRFTEIMNFLSMQDGWFVPVGDILDYLNSVNGHHVINYQERFLLEWKWMFHKIRSGTS